jgi:hypothetical protein
MNYCRLCTKNEATKTNSHIFPKFLGVSMLESKDGARKGYKISSKDGLNKKPEQDTPKEDFIFCPGCESILDHDYENPFALNYFYDRENPHSYFNVIIRNHHVYRVYYKLDYHLFNKFFYSVIFRACISKDESFRNFTLPKNIIEKIRKILINEIPFEQIPLYVLTCPFNPHPTGNFVGSISYTDNTHIIGVNEYILILDLSTDGNIGNKFKSIYNPQYNSVRILTLPYDYWNSWIMDIPFKTVIDRMYKNKMIENIINGIIIDKLVKRGILKRLMIRHPLKIEKNSPKE